MALADDIDKLRSAGKSDDELINSYKQYDPSKAQDIDRLLKAGKSPGQVLDGLASYDKQYGSGAPKPDSYSGIGELRQGAGSILSGYGRTIDALAGQGSGTARALEGAGQNVAGDNQQSAWDVVKDGNRSLLDRAKAVPYAVLGNSPGLATDLAAGELVGGAGAGIGAIGGPVGAAVGGALGGAIGFGGNYLARTFGDNAYRRAASHSNDPSVQPTTEDKLYAAADSGVGAVLSRLGAKVSLGSPTSLAGRSLLEAAPQVAGQVGKGIATEAATSAAQNTADQAILDGKVDPQQVLGAAAVGGVTGGALGASKVPAEVSQQLKFRDIDPKFGDRVADRFDGLDTSNTKKSFQAINKVQGDLNQELTNRASLAKPLIDEHVESTGFQSKLPEDLSKTTARLKAGEVVPDTELQPLRDIVKNRQELGQYLETLEDQNTLNRVKQTGNYNDKLQTFGGGITGTNFGQNFLNPLGSKGRLGDAGLALQGALGMHIPGMPSFGAMHFMDPGTAATIAGAHVGLYGGARAIDSFLGNKNPLDTFTNRFGSEASPGGAAPSPAYPSENMPSARQAQVEAEAAAAAQKDAQKAADGKLKAVKAQTTLMKNSDTLAQRQAKQAQAAQDAPLKQARQAAQIMRNSDALAQRQEAQQAKAAQAASDAPLKAAARTSQLMQSSAALEARQARQAQPTVTNQESAAIPGMSNREVSDTKRSIQALMKREALKQKAQDQTLAAIKQTSGLMSRSEQGPSSDAATAIKVAKLKQGLADQKLASVKQTATLMRNSPEEGPSSDATSALRVARLKNDLRDKKLSSAKQTATLMQRSEEGPSSDAATAIRLAKLKTDILNDKLTNARQTSGLMRTSEQGSTSAAATAIKVAKLKQQYEADRAESEQAPRKTKNGQEKESTAEAGQPKSGPRQANPKGKSQESSPDKVVIRVGDQVVERPRANIRDVNAYATQTRRKMQVRHDAAAAAEKILPRQYHHSLHELLTRLNSSEGQRIDVSYGHIEDFVNSLPEKHWGHAMDILASPQVLATFRKED